VAKKSALGLCAFKIIMLGLCDTCALYRNRPSYKAKTTVNKKANRVITVLPSQILPYAISEASIHLLLGSNWSSSGFLAANRIAHLEADEVQTENDQDASSA
jgi:hypothetical protein